MKTLPIPFLGPVTFAVESDCLGPMYGITFSREDGLQIHFGDRSLVVAR